MSLEFDSANSHACHATCLEGLRLNAAVANSSFARRPCFLCIDCDRYAFIRSQKRHHCLPGWPTLPKCKHVDVESRAKTSPPDRLLQCRSRSSCGKSLRQF